MNLRVESLGFSVVWKKHQVAFALERNFHWFVHSCLKAIGWQRKRRRRGSDRMKNWRMKGWDGIQSSLSSRSSSTLGHQASSRLGQQASSRSVRLGRVQPQAPTHRTIFCNDREANFPIRFKVQPFPSPLYYFLFHFLFVFLWLVDAFALLSSGSGCLFSVCLSEFLDCGRQG